MTASVWQKLLQPEGFQLEKPSLKVLHFLHFMCTRQCLCISNNLCLYFIYGLANASSVWKKGSSPQQSSQNGMKGLQQHLSLGLSSLPVQTGPSSSQGNLCSGLRGTGQPPSPIWDRLQWGWAADASAREVVVPKTPLGQGDRDLAEAVSSREGLQVNCSWWLCFCVRVW